ncbi:MAG TPA: helix-turn-helix domain-containing protein, partial [Vicinamibacterales bacterium]
YILVSSFRGGHGSAGPPESEKLRVVNMDGNPLDDRLLTVAEAAQFLGYAPGTLRNKIARGEIPHVKLGYTVRIRLSDLRRWIEEQDAAAKAARGAKEAA